MLQSLVEEDWLIITSSYIGIALITFLPVLIAILKRVPLHPGGSTYKDSPYLSKEQIARLDQHYSRMWGTLQYWKNRAEKNKRYHVYALVWTTAISIILPILIQLLNGQSHSKHFLTAMSVHSALIFGFYRTFKVEKNYQSFRLAESEFFDLRRSFLDNALKNKNNMDEAIDEFFSSVSQLRINAREEEIDNTPTLREKK